ncbi:hypothetical protein CAPTEDRAFT_202635 [Capitella teleta]|uniref:Uncharacterized protein n=1 Tax=Capitella teleta TaxID=283909 RepID=R7TWW5_CAPTE|nr:hypothetical protein CAPTEDRAFT_202635 [Capitella teleta]|eukprot:ELT95465.1 hypothetical protein CAPTEDRAFT_202635 [Capitella teleta]
MSGIQRLSGSVLARSDCVFKLFNRGLKELLAMEIERLHRHTTYKHRPQRQAPVQAQVTKVSHLMKLIRAGLPWQKIEFFRQAIGESHSSTLKLCLIYHHYDYAWYLLQYHPVTSLQSKACCPLSLLAVRLGDLNLLFILCVFSERLPLIEPWRSLRYIDRRGCDHMELGRTALHIAATVPSPKCVKILLQFSPDLTVKDSTGKTPLQHALTHARENNVTPDYLRCVELLLRAQPTVSLSELQGLSRLRQIAVAHRDNRVSLPAPPRDLKPGPCSLMQMSKLVLRKHIKKHLLVEGDESFLLDRWAQPPRSVLRFVRSTEYLHPVTELNLF